jgi:hypothetical protein
MLLLIRETLDAFPYERNDLNVPVLRTGLGVARTSIWWPMDGLGSENAL